MLTQSDLGKLLGIGQSAIRALAIMGKIPYKGNVSAAGDTLRFAWDDIRPWIRTGPNLETDSDRLEEYRQILLAESPDAMRAIKDFGDRFADRKPPKRFYLVKIPSKDLGFKYYVKYLNNGKLVPSKWCTNTNDEAAATAFAVEKREEILSACYSRRARPPAEMYNIFDKYYEKDSPFLLIDAKRGRTLGDEKRAINDRFVKGWFVPFLKKNGARYVEDIDTAMLSRFQNHLLKTMKPQTVNAYLSAVKMIFAHFVTTGYARNNPCAGLQRLRVKPEDVAATGCYELGRLKGVFGEPWRNRRHYLLCLLIYATGMRNSEINRLQLSDIVEIGGARFIDIPKSKSPNGERRVPLHDFVHGKIVEHARGDDVFPQRPCSFDGLCHRANLSLARHTGYTQEMLKAENIVFYSDRHFWKTMMSAEGLGENAEEVFMGHKTSGDVAKSYNHRDKVGAEKLAEKAREVFAVLDRCLFA